MFYSILFETLYTYGENRVQQTAIDAANGVIDPETGKVVKALSNPHMKIPVRFLIDEAANIGKIPNLDQKISTCRRYRISISTIWQAFSQIEELYGEKAANTIVSNSDALLFLGSSDPSTIKLVHERLGDTTVKILSNSMAQSERGSNSATKSQAKTELMTKAQIMTMSNSECLLSIRALRPFKTKKYNLNRHPNYKYLDEGKEGKSFPNPFCIEYEDEQIENVRVKAPGETGYIKPQVVDSARRRNMIADARKKVAEINEAIEKYTRKLQQTKDASEKEELLSNIQILKAELEKLSKLLPEDEIGNKEIDKTDMEACDETKNADSDKADDVFSMSDIITVLSTDSFAPAYEFEAFQEEVPE